MNRWIGKIDISWAQMYRKKNSQGMGFELWLFHSDVVEGAIEELNTATNLEF